MARSIVSRMYSQLITTAHSENNRQVFEKIPINSSKGTISRAMIDRIVDFAETCDPASVIELINIARETNYVYTDEFALEISSWFPPTTGNKFIIILDVKKGKLLSIRIKIKSCSSKYTEAHIFLKSTAKDVITVVYSGNGSKISNQFLKAAKQIFKECT